MLMNSDADRKAIRQMMGEIVNSMTRDEAERDLRKELFKRLKDEFSVEPKVSRKVVKAMYKGNFAEERESYEEVEALYTAIKSIPMLGATQGPAETLEADVSYPSTPSEESATM